jgi:tetratricopeptide (TPR) repeat protein/tRNA A-37 threonylcarbamoyl transferase component Bud32
MSDAPPDRLPTVAWQAETPGDSGPPATLLRDDQRARWQRGERVVVEAYLDQHPALPPDAQLDLIYNEVVLLQEAGEAPRLEEYLRRFPQFAAQLKDQFEVDQALESGRLFGDARTLVEHRPASPAAAPAAIPGYEVLGVLGRGGMGVVYKARQSRLKREVALKMLLGGPHAAPAQLARFRTEAEAVARLQHANIVQIHEIGEHNGLPYFSLEYVAGGTLAGRLDGTPMPAPDAVVLVETLARAMHYAHERGIVHRDLKPANVLLASGGVPKIADFGLAKHMAGSDVHTLSGTVLGTPSYMAPEQARGEAHAVGPLTDVYALGAILYELLTGRPPFRAASVVETVQQVIDQEPVTPTRLQPKVPRDLETVCLKCLAKKPGQRYASAAALADDLARFLRGEPVLARPAGRWERAAKWARRRPLAAALVAVIVLAVGGLLGVWAGFTVELRGERDRAEANFRRAMRAVDRITDLADEDWLASDPQMERKQYALLNDARQLYEEFLAEKSADPVVRQKAGLAYKRYGDILRLLKDKQKAQEAYGEAIVLLGKLTRAFPDNADYRHALAESYNWRGELERTTGLHARAGESFRRARAQQERLVNAFPNWPDYQRDLARSDYNLAILLREANRADEADAAFAEAIATLEKLSRRFPGEPAYKRELARCQLNRGPVLRARGKALQAEAAYRQAVTLLEDLVAKNRRKRGYRRELMVAYNNAGFYYGQRPPTPLLGAALAGLLAEPQGGGAWLAAAALPGGTPTPGLAQAVAEALHRKALAVGRELVEDSRDVPDYRSELATTHINLGRVLYKRDHAAAAHEWEQARELLRRLVEERPGVPAYKGDLGITQGNLGWLLARRKEWAEAVVSLEIGIANIRAALKPNPADPNYLSALRFQYPQLAGALLALNKPEEAARAARALAALHGDQGADCYAAARLLARCARQTQGDADQSRRHADEAVRLLEQAHARGFRELARLLPSEPAFEVLQSRADFARLLAALSSAKPGKR